MITQTPTKGEASRLKIIEAARDLFITQGFHGTSMRQIAQKSEIALGGIYNHFSGKEAIFEAVFREYHPFLKMLPEIESVHGESVEELVVNAVSKMVEEITHQPEFINLLFIEIVEFNNVHIKDIFNITFPRGIKIVNRIKAIEDNLREIPTPVLIRMFISFFASYYLSEIILGDNAPPQFYENAMDHYIDVFLYGILKRK
jgi:AcrR family transcriptional regulator